MLIFFSTESLHPASMPFSHIQFLVDNLMLYQNPLTLVNLFL